MTAVKPALPDFEGQPVSYAALKFSGIGTGFSDGLKVDPIVLHNGEDAYFVFRGTVAAVDHPLDKDDLTFRRHDLRIVEMAPIDQDTAQKTLQTYAEEIQRRKDEIDGQMRLDDEAAAAEREAADGTADPAEVAQNAADRVRAGQ